MHCQDQILSEWLASWSDRLDCRAKRAPEFVGPTVMAPVEAVLLLAQLEE
jgi:hypothetical protein